MGGTRYLAAAAAVLLVASTAVKGDLIYYDEEDLASDEALWALYERWSAAYHVHRPDHEKAWRFNIFKGNFHDLNKRRGDKKGSTLGGLNCFSDMTMEEFSHMFGFLPLEEPSLLDQCFDAYRRWVVGIYKRFFM